MVASRPLTGCPPDVPQSEDVEFIPCADRLADRHVPFAAAQWVRRRNKPVNVRNDNANRRIEMTANTTTSTRPVAAGAVAQHDCADRGCLAVMLGLALGDATASNAGEGSSLSW
jgi:hypothetical protein